MAGEKFDSKSFNPQAFGAYTERIPNLKKNELIKSRALKGNQDIKNTFSSQTGTVYAVLPMHGLIMAQVAADVEPGTEKGSVVATLGMAVSIVINVSVLTIGAILGTSVLSMLPDTIKAALNYLLPALFGALLVQFGMKMKKHSVIMVVFAIILYFMIGMGYFNWLPGASNWLGTLGCVFVSIAVGMATLKNTTKE